MRSKVVEGRVVISLGLDTLKWCIEHHPDLEFYDAEHRTLHRPDVIDAKVFAEDLVRVLRREDDAGNTLTNRFLDEAIFAAVEDGAGGFIPAGPATPKVE